MNEKDILAAAWQQLEKAIVFYEGRPVGTVSIAPQSLATALGRRPCRSLCDGILCRGSRTFLSSAGRRLYQLTYDERHDADIA